MIEGTVTIPLQDYLDMKHEIDSAPQRSEIARIRDKWQNIFGEKKNEFRRSQEIIDDLNKLLK
jgi:hypothetical protein